MDDPSLREQLQALERRVAALERLTVRSAQPSPQPTGAAPAPARPAELTRSPEQWIAERRARAVPPATSAPLDAGTSAADIEQWLGARGLLLVGVVALLAAAGFFLKYAFDRGWVAPELRVLAAIAAGVVVMAYGEGRIRADMRRFGLALVGSGGGLVYLGVWAAAGPYALVDRRVGIGAAALAAAAASWRAVRHRAEPLALWALLGAFLAPLVLRTPNPNPQVFLCYVAIVGIASAEVSRAMGWRLGFIAGLGGCLLLALALVSDTLRTPLGFLFLTACGVVTLRTPGSDWREVRGIYLPLVWVAFVATAGSLGMTRSWVAFAGALALMLGGWWQHRVALALREPRLSGTARDDVQVAFIAGPVGFALVASLAGGDFLVYHRHWAFAAVGALYLVTGWRGRWAAFVALGWMLVAVGVGLAFSGAALVAALSAMIVAGAVAERWLGQDGLPPVTLMLVLVVGAAALLGLFDVAGGESVLLGPQSAAFYAYVAASVFAAAVWGVGEGKPDHARVLRDVTWAMAGLVVFVGVSAELARAFDARLASWPGARLAGALALSAWWLCYAALLVWIGFARRERRVRWAGLAVAALAAAKIALVDLSDLQALYRVAAFFLLALIALAVAYAYNRPSRGAAGGDGSG